MRCNALRFLLLLVVWCSCWCIAENRDYEEEVVPIYSQVILGVHARETEADALQAYGDEAVRRKPLSVISVDADSPAAMAGMQQGDLLYSINAEPMRTRLDLLLFLQSKRAGDAVYAVVLRNGEKKMLTVTLRPRKKPELVGHLYKMPSGDDKIRESEKIGIRNLRALSVCPAALETVRSSCLAYAALFNKPAGTDGFGVYYFDACGEILVLYKKGDILVKVSSGHVAQECYELRRQGDTLPDALRRRLLQIALRYERRSGAAPPPDGGGSR